MTRDDPRERARSIPAHVLEPAVAVTGEAWLRLAGPLLARRVAAGLVCDRCARSAMVTVGIAAGIAAVPLAHAVRDGYDEELERLIAGQLEDVVGDLDVAGGAV